MIVYVVYCTYMYESGDPPDAVFLSEKAARNYVAKQNIGAVCWRYRYTKLEVTMDEEATELRT